MSNPPSNPNNPPNPSDPNAPKGPWLYSGADTPQPAYIPPPTTPAAPTPPAAVTAPAPPVPPTPPRPPRTPAPAPLPEKSDPSLAGIVDTIEAIIIALILALTFRAFIVEAFVIPTGSMAPTLKGAHFKVICPKCGYEYDYDADLGRQYNPATGRLEPQGDHAELTSNTTVAINGAYGSEPIVCPNCHYVIPYDQFPQYLGSRQIIDGASYATAHFGWANNGDRILVLKYLYALLAPQRWDVIVFKEPLTARDNYIKRLIGLPGETIEVIGGDVYVAPPGASLNPVNRVIARKPPAVQSAVWQLVYDNDYYPTDEGDPRPSPNHLQLPPVWTNPWRPLAPNGWKVAGPVISYAPNPAEEKIAAPLRFYAGNLYGFNTLGYNNDIYEFDTKEPLHRVGDLRLETTWIPAPASSPAISLLAGLPNNCWQVAWGADGLKLTHFDPANGKPIAVPVTPLASVSPPAPGQPHHVALENVDRSIRFFIDNKLVLNYETPWTAADALREQDLLAAASLPPGPPPLVQVESAGPATLAHLKLFRDLFYTQSDPSRPSPMFTANMNRPLTLGPDEFFPMGDNSRKSSDGRYWTDVYRSLDDLGTRRGIVPRRYLLGKAFFVYWPAGYRATSNNDIPLLPHLPIVPNFGDMRLIR